MEKVQIFSLQKIGLFIIFSFFFTSNLMAQELPRKERKTISEQAIKDLKGGTLILRLKSKRNKINKLEELIADPDVKKSVQLKLNNELKNTIDKRNRDNITLIEAFEDYYSFSNIYYMYDSASVSLKNGKRIGIFLDKNLELDPAIEIPEGPFFVVKKGTTNFTSTTGIQALVVMDNQLKDLFRPFPYYVRINSIGRLFTRIFNHRNLVKKDSRNVVKRLDSNLNKYAKVVIR